MKIFKLDSMVNGWFVGDFSPSVWQSEDFEVAVKYYKNGDYEAKHYHKVATEITLIIQGRVRMGNAEFREGQIILLEPCESVDFEALTDAITAVVKVPSVKNDKFLGESKGATKARNVNLDSRIANLDLSKQNKKAEQ